MEHSVRREERESQRAGCRFLCHVSRFLMQHLFQNKTKIFSFLSAEIYSTDIIDTVFHVHLFSYKSNLIKARDSRLKSYLSRFYDRPTRKDDSQTRPKKFSARWDCRGFYLSSSGAGFLNSNFVYVQGEYVLYKNK